MIRPVHKKIQVRVSENGVETTRDLTFSIVAECQNASARSYGEPLSDVLHFELTDDADPLYFLKLNLSEFEFLDIKKSLYLNCDFQSFPIHLAKLFDYCSAVNSREVMVRLDTSGAAEAGTNCHFSILERNSFRLVTLISLQFRKASDSDIKEKLATMVKELSVRLASLNICLEEQRSKQYLSRDAEEQQIRMMNEMRDTHARELAKIKEESTASLSQKLSDLELNLRESIFREDTMKQEMKILQEKHSEQVKEMRRLLRRKDTLKKQVHEFERVESINAQRFEKCQTHLKNLKVENNSLKSYIGNLQNVYQELTAEVDKGNEIIKQFYSERKAFNATISKKNKVILAQEKAVTDGEKKISYLKANILRIKNESQEAASKMTQEKYNHDSEIMALKAALSKKNKVLLAQEDHVTKGENIISALKMKLKELKNQAQESNFRMTQMQQELEESRKEIAEKAKIIEKNAELIESIRPASASKPVHNRSSNATQDNSISAQKNNFTFTDSKKSQNVLSETPYLFNRSVRGAPQVRMGVPIVTPEEPVRSDLDEGSSFFPKNRSSSKVPGVVHKFDYFKEDISNQENERRAIQVP